MATAREILEEARQAARDTELAQRQLELMATTARKVDERLEAPRRKHLERRLSEAAVDLRRATEMLYGPSGEALTELQREVIYMRYVRAATWAAISNAVGYSERPCQYARAEGLEKLEKQLKTGKI